MLADKINIVQRHFMKYLNDELCRFCAVLTGEGGHDYEPDCLRMIMVCVDRHLRENGATDSILTDKHF